MKYWEHFAGRLKSPPIDDITNMMGKKSIGGDFNRPAKCPQYFILQNYTFYKQKPYNNREQKVRHHIKHLVQNGSFVFVSIVEFC
jgi:hypothetical protein